MEMSNRYRGHCHACARSVDAGAGIVEGINGKWQLWCMACYNKSDNSGYEDRCCGNRAYEDACAMACGYDNE